MQKRLPISLLAMFEPYFLVSKHVDDLRILLDPNGLWMFWRHSATHQCKIFQVNCLIDQYARHERLFEVRLSGVSRHKGRRWSTAAALKKHHSKKDLPTSNAAKSIRAVIDEGSKWPTNFGILDEELEMNNPASIRTVSEKRHTISWRLNEPTHILASWAISLTMPVDDGWLNWILKCGMTAAVESKVAIKEETKREKCNVRYLFWSNHWRLQQSV